MATTVILPKLGQTMEEGTIVQWLKKEGDTIGRGDVLFQVESDKAVLEVEAKTRGVLRKILVDKGNKIPVLTPVAIIARPDEDISEALSAESRVPSVRARPSAATPTRARSVPPGPTLESGRERILSSPRARRLAAEKGVSLSLIVGSGPNGRIVEKDVLFFLEAQPLATPLARKVAAELGVPLTQVVATGARVTADDVRAAAQVPVTPPAAEVEIVPLSGVRAVIADRMVTSARTTAAVTLQSVVDATELVALRNKLKMALADELGFNVGYNDLLAVIVARCLAEFPYMNVRLEESGIRRLKGVNLGMAVDSDRGLLVPVIRNADRLTIKEFAVKFRELVARAREGKALHDDLTGGSFTITNLGMFGVDAFTPIIRLPECAILGVGRIHPEPAIVGGEIVVRQRMWLSLTFDHRLVDGGPAARFLQGITRYVEEPYLLLA
ncbi:MAG: 2-oxo acid dehydrogenase subunit E2 [Anaerolineales bacterium]|nr:MAG: 2-oxo acid dehydrogenase subunit E2 [Anaerolineales bacterium]